MKTAEKQLDCAGEKRRNVRSGITIDGQHVRFRLKSDSKDYVISSMRDVSISGVGIVISGDDNDLPPGAKIALEYRDQDFAITVGGAIAWRNPAGSNPGMMGVKFDPRNHRDNCLFFLALRKYLDEFDGTYIDA